ncbi:MAG TPA: hybrid sensor histidine kinase/response regulator [Oscillatoriaceae cyanobacterium]
MGQPVRILIVEDNEDDALLLVRDLKRGDFVPTWARVETPEAFDAALEQPWDAVIADWSLPRFSGLAALKMLRAHGLDLPFMIVSGTIVEEAAVAAMKAGANDYLRKGDLGRLAPALARELRDAAERRGRRVAEKQRQESVIRERETRADLEAARELDHLKSQFVNAVSHELRTPITTIMGYAEFMEDRIGGELTAQQSEFVEQISASAKRLARLVDDLLDFARLEAGTFRLQLAESDFAAPINEVVESLKPQAEAAQITLEVALGGQPLLLRMDAQRIEQVLINLVGNAIKFTPPGGTIRLSARLEGGTLRCEVTDTGIGISPDDVPKLFQKFSQLESGARKGGTGLGLSISKALVEAHGGHIGVKSQPGKGSTFWFTLPLKGPGPTALPKGPTERVA